VRTIDERALEEDSSYDEDDPLVPRDWQELQFLTITINPGENMPLEYKENEVSVGTMYSNPVDLKDVVKRWATLSLQTEFNVVNSSPHIYYVCCLKPNCPFRVRITGRLDMLWITLVYLTS
jgi:hypothetical protein